MRVVDEPSAKALLRAYGARTPAGGVVRDAAAAVAVLEGLRDAGGPLGQADLRVVVKGVGAAHKTDLDGVRLGLRTAEEVEHAASDLLERFDAVLVEELVDQVLAELLVSVDLDPTFGPVLTLGWGGTRTELHADTSRLVLPSTRQAVRAALLGLRCAPLLTGHRGAPAADLEATLDAIEAIVAAAVDGTRSVEVNPLVVTAHGAWVADALVVEHADPSPTPDTSGGPGV